MTIFERYFSGENLRLSENIRSGLSGRFVQLSNGFTHFDLAGPENGPVVILIHGFSVPLFIWDPSIESLAKAGYRVLRYDLFGRGYSDRPLTEYDKHLFRRQLSELIQQLNIQSKVNLISLSMGAVVAADFTKHHVQKVNKLIFIDPAGFDLHLPWLSKLLLLPIFGEIMLGVLGFFGRQRLLQSMLADFYKPGQAAIEAFSHRYVDQMQYQGFKRALLSTLRNGVLDENFADYKALGQTNIPVQLIWGRHDSTVPFSHNRKFQELVPQAEFHPIDQAGHLPHFEQPDIVNPLLISFLQS